MNKFTDEEWTAYLKEHQTDFEGEPDHLRILLERGVEGWNTWRDENPEIDPNLLSANLASPNSIKKTAIWDAEESSSNLNSINFQDCCLIFCVIGSLISDANLKGADLSYASIGRTFLLQSDLSETYCHETNFMKSDLSEVNFSNSEIHDCNFVGSDLAVVNMDGAEIIRSNFSGSDFTGSSFRESNVRKSDFERANLKGATFSGARIHSCNIKYSDLSYCNFGKSIFLNNDYEHQVIIGQFDLWRKNTISSFEGINMDGCQGDALFKRYAMDQDFLTSFKRAHPIIYWPWKISSNCGQSTTIWIIWSILLATFFALGFYNLGPDSFYIAPSGLRDFTFHNLFYYSVVTFTTLGFGDIIPKTPEAARWVMAEVITGYIMLGGLISIFATKLARRS